MIHATSECHLITLLGHYSSSFYAFRLLLTSTPTQALPSLSLRARPQKSISDQLLLQIVASILVTKLCTASPPQSPIRRRDVRSRPGRPIYTISHLSCTSSARPLITLHHPNPSCVHPEPYHSSTDHRSGISDIEDIPPESGKAARGRGRG